MNPQFNKARLRWIILLNVINLIIVNALLATDIFACQSDIEETVKALTWEDTRPLRQKAEAGNAEAQYMLGRAYHLGQAFSRDFAEAVKWYKKAAEQGNGLAELRLSQMFFNGEGVPKDAVEATKRLRKAAELGNDIAQWTYAYAIEQQGDFLQAAEWYRKAAEQGFSAAQCALGFFYEKGLGVKEDYKEAANWYRKAADQGDANAQSNLGNMYTEGKGVAQDYEQAAKWFRLSADNGWPVGQINLAISYMLGRGVTRDFISAYMWCFLAAAGGQSQCNSILQMLASQMKPEEIDESKKRAEAWSNKHRQMVKVQGDLYVKAPRDVPESVKKIRDAAESGDAKAQSVLGEIFYRARNYEEAIKWFGKSAKQGYSYGQYNLGVMYFEGSGVTRNESEAVMWFTKAAEQLHIGAINNLASAHFDGKGVPKDMISTYMWMRIGASAGDAISAKNLEAIKKLLTEEQINEAESRASAWQEEHKRQ